MTLVISTGGKLGEEVCSPVSELLNPTWLFSFHPVLTEAPTASRVMEGLMSFEPKRALFGGMEAYQQGYV